MTKKTKKKDKRKRKKRKTVKRINKKEILMEKPKRRLTVSKIICSKCNTEKKTNKIQMDKLVSKFGTLELVHEKYHCIDCRRKYNVRKDGKAKPVKQTRKKKIKLNGKVPDWMVGDNKVHVSSGILYCKLKNGISNTKWEKAVRETVEWGIKEGILLPTKGINGK